MARGDVDPLTPRVLARFLDREGYGTPGGWEHRKERDEAVVVNIPPHLQALWRKTKNKFKGTPEKRLEQFLQYVHEHEGEEMGVLQDEAEAQLAKMIREYERRPQHHYDEGPVPFSG
jgi:hypothetical protein